jgi:hypothetical protein
MKSLKNPTFFLHSKWGLHAINGGLTARQKDHNFTNKKFYPDKSVEYLQFCTTTTYLNGMTLKDRRGGEWEPIKIPHGIWPISQNQPDTPLF